MHYPLQSSQKSFQIGPIIIPILQIGIRAFSEQGHFLANVISLGGDKTTICLQCFLKKRQPINRDLKRFKEEEMRNN